METKACSSQEHCPVEHLATILAQCREEILEEWCARTADLLRSLHLDKTTLTDHIPAVVDQVIGDLTTRREDAGVTEKMQIVSPHGAQRVGDGLDIGEVVEEFGLLRAAFTTVMDRHGLCITGEAARIINRRIDFTLRDAVVTFADLQARNLKTLDEEHLAFVVHDLRTPLSVIVLLAYVLEKERAENVNSDETLELMKRNCKRMDKNIKRMMKEHAERSQGHNVFHPQSRNFELWPMVQELCVDLRTAAAEKSIKIINKVPYLMTVWGDAGLVTQVLQNLLSNAFAHAPGGQVVITAKEDEKCICCCVQDDGKGIPVELLPTIFEKHVTTSERPGSGLGLAIVKKIVEGHGGSVSVESSAAAGTTICFTLPMESDGSSDDAAT